jgi:hypothetical protein
MTFLRENKIVIISLLVWGGHNGHWLWTGQPALPLRRVELVLESLPLETGVQRLHVELRSCEAGLRLLHGGLSFHLESETLQDSSVLTRLRLLLLPATLIKRLALSHTHRLFVIAL